MGGKHPDYNAIVSSDWNECLAPCGPFDCISFNYPELKFDLENIFKQYTGNKISLGRAVGQIQQLLPGPITEEHMDAYLDKCFSTYPGVPELIQWCMSKKILFMINTTGMIGYFQRIYAKGLLPHQAIISAHPLVRYPARRTDPQFVYELIEIEDKGKNTEAVVRSLNIPAEKIILIGDSGGDGPHFKWGAKRGAFLVGSMPKPSLEQYCRTKGVRINLRFGWSYAEGEKKDLQKEMQVDFKDLSLKIEEFLGFH